MSKVIELTDLNFDKEITDSKEPVLVDFWAPWCGHCRVQAPILDEFASEVGDKVKIAKVNVDENQKKAAQFGITGIPAILVFRNGKLVDQEAGVHQKADLKRMLASYI